VATTTFITAYALLMFITIPVMRWMFRAELQEVVEKTILPVFERNNQLAEMVADLVGEWQSIDEPIVVPVAKRAIPRPKKAHPMFHYNTQTNQLVCCFVGFDRWTYDMSDKVQSQQAMEMIAFWNDQQQNAEEDLEEAQELLFEIQDSIATKAERHRGHEWGVKSKLRK
jgi:hypothetical protein